MGHHLLVRISMGEMDLVLSTKNVLYFIIGKLYTFTQN